MSSPASYPFTPKEFKTLPFCPRYLCNHFDGELDTPIKEIFNNGIISSHPPLIETCKDAKVAQFEHTIYVKENGVEILT